jgi:hypothetical protein
LRIRFIQAAQLPLRHFRRPPDCSVAINHHVPYLPHIVLTSVPRADIARGACRGCFPNLSWFSRLCQRLDERAYAVDGRNPPMEQRERMAYLSIPSYHCRAHDTSCTPPYVPVDSPATS